MKLVSLITVNFNQHLVTEALLESVISLNVYENIELIAVDNGSLYNPVPVWEQKYPQFRFIRSETNLGFAGGNNLAIREAAGDYIFLVNNDTIVTADLVLKLTRVLDTFERAGVVSPLIHYYDRPDMIQYAGYTRMNFFTGRNRCIGQFEEDKGQYDGPARETAYAHGAAMMVSREVLETAGLMDERYFLYYEELDWCERIRRSGYKIFFEPSALIYHKESVSVGKTTGLKEFFMHRNRILFIRKNAGAMALMLFCVYYALVVIPRCIAGYVLSGRPGLITVLFRAVGWHFTHAPDSADPGYPVSILYKKG